MATDRCLQVLITVLLDGNRVFRGDLLRIVTCKATCLAREDRRDEECLALVCRRSARLERGLTGSLAPSICETPAAVREPPPWTGLHGGLNVGYGWDNQPFRETRDAVIDGQQAVNAGAFPASLAGRPLGLRCGRSTRGWLSSP